MDTQQEVERYTQVEAYISGLVWSPQATEEMKTLVAGNIRAFAATLPDPPEFMCFLKDDDGHLYVIPSQSKVEFNRLVELYAQDYDNDNILNEFTERFSHLRL